MENSIFTTALQSSSAGPTSELEMDVLPALVIDLAGSRVIYWGIHGGIPPWIWESI